MSRRTAQMVEAARASRVRVAAAPRPAADVRVIVFVLLAIAIACALLAASPVKAFAYDKKDPTRACSDCHGGDKVDASRKGPHGGYTTGTQKCQTCHTMHGAGGSILMLPGETIKATCETCHDGTGGQDVYGVLEARGVIPTGTPAPAAHRIEVTNQIPGGAADGGMSYGKFAAGGLLTCTDCHSPHDANTVAPFIGDRKRSEDDSAAASVATNRLLRKNPGSSETTVTEYGAQWCADCHAGSNHSNTTMSNHPSEIETAYPEGEAFTYGRVARVAGQDTTTTEIGPLGGSNAGYVMPDLNGTAPGAARTAQQGTHAPICQQCHEDARNVGDFADVADQGQLLTADKSATGRDEGFRPAYAGVETTAHAADPKEYYNPRFQTFPHESPNRAFLIEQGDDLCLNCHAR